MVQSPILVQTIFIFIENEENQEKIIKDNETNKEEENNNKVVISEKIKIDKSQKNKKIYENQLQEETQKIRKI